MHGQWDWMRDPKIHSTTWEWDNASPVRAVEALAQRAAPHVHERDRQGQRPRLRHHARRRGPALAARSTSASRCGTSSTPASSSTASRPTTSSSARTSQRRSAARTRSSRPRAKAGADARSASRSPRTTSSTRCCRARRSCTTLAANVTANLVRNLWTHSVIMCGHFPEGVETFEQPLDRGRDPRRVVPAPDARLGQHLRQQGHAPHDRQPVAPDRAPPVPGPAEQPLRRDRPAGAGALRALRPDLHHRPAAPAGRLAPGTRSSGSRCPTTSPRRRRPRCSTARPPRRPSSRRSPPPPDPRGDGKGPRGGVQREQPAGPKGHGLSGELHLWRSGGERRTVAGCSRPDPRTHGRHASPDPPEVDEPRLGIDVGGRPSMYSQAQESAEVKGLTLHTDPFELRRELQRSIEAMDARDKAASGPEPRQATPRACGRHGGPLAGGSDGAACPGLSHPNCASPLSSPL